MRNPYQILGVSESADMDEIKKAYRKLSRMYHPDANINNPNKDQAEAKFKEVQQAYDQIVKEREQGYSGYGQSYGQGYGGYGNYGQGDQNYGGYGPFGGFGGFGDFGDLGDIFGSFFGGGSTRRANPNAPRRGENVGVRLELTFEEAAFGCEKEISIQRIENCSACSGSGSADGKVETCPTCRGAGQVRTTQNFMGMSMQSTTVCPNCNGSGKHIKTPCSTCRGKGKVRRTQKLKVRVPAGIDMGQAFRVSGQGSVGANGGPNGDVMVEVYIRKHPIFLRNGMDVHCEVPISFAQAALGAEIEVPTIDGKVKYEIPEGTQTGKEFVLRDKGIPEVGNSRRRGNHRFTVVVETPTKLTKEQKELLRQLDATLDKNGTPKIKKFFDTVKDFFD